MCHSSRLASPVFACLLGKGITCTMQRLLIWSWVSKNSLDVCVSRVCRECCRLKAKSGFYSEIAKIGSSGGLLMSHRKPFCMSSDVWLVLSQKGRYVSTVLILPDSLRRLCSSKCCAQCRNTYEGDSMCAETVLWAEYHVCACAISSCLHLEALDMLREHGKIHLEMQMLCCSHLLQPLIASALSFQE